MVLPALPVAFSCSARVRGAVLINFAILPLPLSTRLPPFRSPLTLGQEQTMSEQEGKGGCAAPYRS